MRVRDVILVAMLAALTFGGTFTCRSDFDDDDDHRHHHDRDDVVIIRGSEASGESGGGKESK